MTQHAIRPPAFLAKNQYIITFLNKEDERRRGEEVREIRRERVMKKIKMKKEKGAGANKKKKRTRGKKRNDHHHACRGQVIFLLKVIMEEREREEDKGGNEEGERTRGRIVDKIKVVSSIPPAFIESAFSPTAQGVFFLGPWKEREKNRGEEGGRRIEERRGKKGR